MDAMTFLSVETQAFQVKHMDAFFGNRSRCEGWWKTTDAYKMWHKKAPQGIIYFTRTFTFYFFPWYFCINSFWIHNDLWEEEISASE